ncbi:hypothetical protein LEP1GSC013_0464 [Leptospira interrogans serovar Valbuzzi str. Duyster]|nr:hypothetical protein LEP1GSC013_0464 [Leptospira interrogans serovar Valbuzzi str. Duyster]ENO73344.1 hypothetical protein LEP1GSC012_3077 [Leptospira interrogans serovar Valbuzzi str. Valbuzzi]
MVVVKQRFCTKISLEDDDSFVFYNSSHNRIVEKLILHLFLFYGNGQLKQFC